MTERASIRWSATDVTSAALAAALLLAFAPPTLFPSWTPRMAILLAVLVPGVALLGWQARTDHYARIATALVVIVWATSLLSDNPWTSAVGVVGRDLSAIVVTSAFGIWAIARSSSTVGRARAVQLAAALGAVVALLGVLQLALGLETGSLALFDGRPSSLFVNPVYFGGVCAACAVLASWHVDRFDRVWFPATVIIAAGCAVSGSRVAVASLVALLAFRIVRERTRPSMFGGLAAAIGLVGGALVDLVASNQSATGRLTSGDGSGRLTVWRYGLEAVAERPVLGFGIGRFRAAVQGRFTPTFVSEYALDENVQPWFDAHNVVIAIAVGVGVPGLLVAGWFVWTSARAASGPAAWAALALGMTWLLQPMSLHTFPLAMLFLGVAMPTPEPFRIGGRVRTVILGSAVVSGLLAVGLVASDLRLSRAVDRLDADGASAAANSFLLDPVVADVVAQVEIFEAGPGSQEDALAWWRRAADREPDRPLWWTRLARAEIDAGELASARESLDRALSLQPTNYAANLLALEISVSDRDRTGTTELLERLCGLDAGACNITYADLIEGS